MKWLGVDYDGLLALPDGYIEVIIAVAKKENQERRARGHSGRGRRGR